MYQALYRKWRPRSFDDVVGQEHVTQTLKRQVREDKISHAYLFVGTRGTGKTTCAKILARAVNCENPIDGNPCNCCPSCLGIESGAVMDVEELDAASNNGVDNIRALREEAVFSPAEVKKRVYIVDEVHMLSTSAFNALLKILEEPPAHLIFILATTELHKVPATILSRCQRFQFKRISDDSMRRRMEYVAAQEGMSLTEDAAALLARLAEGSLRDGLSLLDQCAWEGTIDTQRVNDTVGLAGNDGTRRLLDAIAAGDAGTALSVLDGLWREGKDMASVLGELSGLMRDALIVRVTRDRNTNLLSGMYDRDLVISCAKAFGPARLTGCINALQSAVAEMYRNAGRRTVAELCIIRICREELDDAPAALYSRVEKLEEALRNGNFAAAPSAPVDITNETPAPTRPAAAAKPEQEDLPWRDDPPEPRPVPKAPAPPARRAEPERRPVSTAPNAAPVREAAAQQPTPTQPAAGDKGGWSAIFEAAKPRLERLARIYLSNAANFRAELNGARLELGIYAQGTLDYLDREEVRSVLGEAVTQVTGKPAVVTMALATPQVQKRSMDELENLLKLKGLG